MPTSNLVVTERSSSDDVKRSALFQYDSNPKEEETGKGHKSHVDINAHLSFRLDESHPL